MSNLKCDFCGKSATIAFEGSQKGSAEYASACDQHEQNAVRRLKSFGHTEIRFYKMGMSEERFRPYVEQNVNL